MSNNRLTSFPHHDPHRVKPVEESRSPETPLPHPGHPLDLAAFQRRDSRQRVAIAVSRPGLDLDKGDQVLAADDEVDLAVAEAEVAVQDGVADALQIASGKPLSGDAEIV